MGRARPPTSAPQHPPMNLGDRGCRNPKVGILYSWVAESEGERRQGLVNRAGLFGNAATCVLCQQALHEDLSSIRG
jgi:hypothetical protein